MDTWQIISLVVAALLSAMLWRERSKRLKATGEHDLALMAMSAKHDQDRRTGLMTLEAFDKALLEAITQADQTGGVLAVMAVALDNFGLIQDGFGDEVSSEVLKLTGQRIVTSAGEGASVCKADGGEFALLLHCDAEGAVQVAKRILTEIAKPFEWAGNQTHSTCSIGIATYPEHGAYARIMGMASMAMRTLKNSGGADYCLYDPLMAERARDEALLVNELRQAIESNQFTLYFQPKIDARSLQITAAEALMRWHHPLRGFISPVIFIPLAEKYGLMGSIGRWVIEEASRNAAVWLKSGLRMRVAVNISGIQMRQDDLVEHILSILQHHGLAPERFTCEITETVAMEDTAATKLTFDKMRQAGLHVSIDDFGTGHSSLGALRKLPAAELKIDRAFVSDLEQSEAARSIAKSIVEMAIALKLKVIAEGVETVGQRDILVRMGCDELQGFLFSKPIPADELYQLAMNRHSGETSDFRDSLYATNFGSNL